MAQNEIAIFFDEAVLGTSPPNGLFERDASPLLVHQSRHAETPERIANTRAVLQRGPLAGRISWHAGREATDAELLSFHTQAYLNSLKLWDETGHWATGTTYFPKGGLATMRSAAGTTLEAVRYALAQPSRRAYALVRPPSHHASPAVADGYCFVNAVAIAALDALARGCKRVAIVDWDVHHGNGTQEGFYDRADVLVVSMHMDHGAWGISHPQTGGIEEIGSGAGEGLNVNIPLPMGCGDESYVKVMEHCVVPLLERFGPDLVLVSNGQDASQFDPNGRQLVTMRGFHTLARLLRRATDRICAGRLVAVQEGGYNPAYSPFCAYATVAGFLDAELDIEDPLAFYPNNGELADPVLARLAAEHPLFRSLSGRDAGLTGSIRWPSEESNP